MAPVQLGTFSEARVGILADKFQIKTLMKL